LARHFFRKWPHVLFSDQAYIRSNHQKSQSSHAHTPLTQSSTAKARHSS
jgi:hypothetical protein